MTPNELEIVRTTWNQFEIVLADRVTAGRVFANIRQRPLIALLQAAFQENSIRTCSPKSVRIRLCNVGRNVGRGSHA